MRFDRDCDAQWQLTIHPMNKYSVLLPRQGSRGRAMDSWSKSLGFESRQEQGENFLLQGQLSVLTLISVSIQPPCYCSSMLKILAILPKVQVAGYRYTPYVCGFE